jgi:hypothetical protein
MPKSKRRDRRGGTARPTAGDVLKELKRVEKLATEVHQPGLPTVGLVLLELDRVKAIVDRVRDKLDDLPKDRLVDVAIQDDIIQCNVGKACKR